MHDQFALDSDSTTPLCATLIALSMSQLGAHKIRDLRDELWKTTGNPSFLTLFPLIPLLWTKIGSRLPRALQLPALRTPPTIHPEPCHSQGSLFLPVQDAGQLQLMRNILSEWYRQTVESQSDSPPPVLPFPMQSAAVYLGADSPTARQRVQEVSERLKLQSTPIKDFRLVTIDMQTTSDWQRDFRYQVWQDRHLSIGNQTHRHIEST